MSQPKLSPQTMDAIDHDLVPHLAGAAAAPSSWMTSVSTLFQLLLPVLIQVLQAFAASGTVPTAANVFKAGHLLTSQPDPSVPS